jgi:hypothetical protein
MRLSRPFSPVAPGWVQDSPEVAFWAPLPLSGDVLGTGGYFHMPTPSELRQREQQDALDAELEALRRAQDEMQKQLRQQPGARWGGGKTDWLKN